MSAKKKMPKRKSTRRKKKKIAHPSYKFMILEAISENRNKILGATRPAIASYIKLEYEMEGGARFNSHLRRALTSGIELGILKQGSTNQRFKMTADGKKERKATIKKKDGKKPKKKTPKRKKKKPKKKATKKKTKKKAKKKTTKRGRPAKKKGRK
eukprot:477105_1